MAFERIPSGYPGVDEVFDYIRMGDNVVWQVSDLEEYRLFAEALPRLLRGRRWRTGGTSYICTMQGMSACSVRSLA